MLVPLMALPACDIKMLIHIITWAELDADTGADAKQGARAQPDGPTGAEFGRHRAAVNPERCVSHLEGLYW